MPLTFFQNLKLTRFFAVFSSLCFVLLSLVFLHSSPAHAQANTSQNITMSPASTLLSIQPGATVEKSFQILNSGGDAYSVFTTVSPYHVSGLQYDPSFTQLPGTTDTASWVKISNASTTVGPQKLSEIKYSVSVPEGTPPGGYYAVLFAETRPIDTTERSGVVPRNRVGNILYITVEGAVKMSGEVKAEPVSGFQYRSSIPVGFKVSNTGGIHFQSTVKVSVKGIAGKELYNATIERYILPQTERSIPINWTPSSPVGIYTVSRTATAAGENKKIADETFIYVQPWVIVAIIVLLIGIVLFLKTQASARRKNQTEKPPKNKKG